jgi:hypothetical protein
VKEGIKGVDLVKKEFLKDEQVANCSCGKKRYSGELDGVISGQFKLQ